MHKLPKEPAQPAERHETIRQYIIAILRDFTISAKELSGYLKISERDVYDHLEHIRKTMNKGGFTSLSILLYVRNVVLYFENEAGCRVLASVRFAIVV